MPRLLCVILCAGLGLVPDRSIATPPADWRDQTVYQIVTDRFFNADPSNDNLGGTFDPSAGARAHGGDFQGLTAKLDYIVSLGVDAVWISPVVLNANGEYHGYAARDLFTFSPQMGGLSGLQDFVSAAHARGLKVMIDIVANHLGDLIGSFSSGYPDFNPAGGYNLVWWNANKKHAPPFDDLSLFHDHGEIQDFVDPEQELGELFGLDDLDTSQTLVRDTLVQAYVDLVSLTDCDGFRIDTVKHAEIPFWQDFLPRMRTALDAMGKTNFLMFGEVFDGDPAKVGIYTGTKAGGTYLLDSVTWFPMTFAARWVFSGDGFPAAFQWTLGDDVFYDPSVVDRRGLFFDNHDIGRLASEFGLANQDDTLLRQANVWLLTMQGMPILYYGSEQEFDGGSDPWNREDMWDGQWDFGPSQGQSFNMTSTLYQQTRLLQDLRHTRPALTVGGQAILYADSDGPGIFVNQREDPVDPTQDVLVMMNTSTFNRGVPDVTTRFGSGTLLTDALGSGRTLTVGPGGVVGVNLPARSAFVMVASLPPMDLRVASTWPRHDGLLQLSSRPARISFDRPVAAGILSRVTVTGVANAVPQLVDDRTITVKPPNGWPHNASVTVTVDADATAQDGTSLGAGFETGFRTSFTNLGLSLLPSHEATEIRPFGLKWPGALEVPPSGWMPQAADALSPLVADLQRSRVFRLSTRWHLPTHAMDDILSSVRAMEMAWGDLFVATGEFVLRLNPDGSVGGLTALGAAARDLALAFDPPVLLATTANGDILQITEAGATSTLSSSLANAYGLAVAPLGHADAGMVLVSDPQVDGPGSGELFELNSSGGTTPWLSDPAVRNVTALEFAPAGSFGLGLLYLADAALERVVRVDGNRTVSNFATGFNNLHGPDVLAMGREDDLYISDPGGIEPGTNPGTGASPRVVRIVMAQNTTAAPDLADAFRLHPPYPNPFNPSVQIGFSVPRSGSVLLTVHDVAGRRVTTLLDGRVPAGDGERTWTGRDEQGRSVASGVYYARFWFDGGSQTQKLVLVR